MNYQPKRPYLSILLCAGMVCQMDGLEQRMDQFFKIVASLFFICS